MWPLARARRGWPLFWALVHRVGGAAAALAVPGKVPKQPWFIRQKYNKKVAALRVIGKTQSQLLSAIVLTVSVIASSAGAG